MLRLQIAISNLRPTNHHEEAVEEVSLKFASISTCLPIYNGQGGKTLFLEIYAEEMQQIFGLFACGLFVETRQGRYFSLLSLQRLKVGDQVLCQQICFFNDLRETKFKCSFSIAANPYKNPRIAETNKFKERELALDSLKKPPVPKQAQFNNFMEQAENKKPFSFLNGNQQPKQKKEVYLPDHLKTMKNGVLKPNPRKSEMGRSREKQKQIPRELMSKQAELLTDDGDLLDSGPPPMEFTNEEEPQIYQVPQVQHLEYYQSIGQSAGNKARSHVQQSTQPKFPTFNRNSNQQRRASPETPSQFQLQKKESKPHSSKPKALTKQEIRQMARQQAESRVVKNNILIPIAKGEQFELVPLSSLKPEEIIDYVHRQRKTEEEALANEQRRRKLQQQQRQAEEKNKRLQQALEKRQRQLQHEQKQSRQDSYIRRSSINKSRKGSVNELIQVDQQSSKRNEEQDDYASDFESMSLTGSAIRSRISSRGGVHKNPPKEEQNVMQEQYSQQFDSYSMSMLSKTNANRNKVPSVSDYTDSYHSISQSYRK